MPRELGQALVAVWLILSLAGLALLVAPFVVPEDALLELGRRLQGPGHGDEACALCGLTRASAALARGELARAHALNGLALPLYGALLGNEILAGTYLLVRARKAARAAHEAGKRA